MAEDINHNHKSMQIPLYWGSDKNLQTTFANQLFITHSGGEFYLVFGEVILPPFLNASELPDELEITPKVRLAVTPTAMHTFATLIIEQLGHLHEEEDEE